MRRFLYHALLWGSVRFPNIALLVAVFACAAAAATEQGGMGNTSSGPFVDLFGETVVAESAEKAARWALASSFVDLAGTFFPAFSLDNVLLLPRATVLQRGRRALPTYAEAAKGLRSTAEVSSSDRSL
jgi:hypothetical protein